MASKATARSCTIDLLRTSQYLTYLMHSQAFASLPQLRVKGTTERTTYSIDVIFIHSGQAGRSIIRLKPQRERKELLPVRLGIYLPTTFPRRENKSLLKWEEKPMDCGGFIRHSPLGAPKEGSSPYFFFLNCNQRRFHFSFFEKLSKKRDRKDKLPSKGKQALPVLRGKPPGFHGKLKTLRQERSAIELPSVNLTS